MSTVKPYPVHLTDWSHYQEDLPLHNAAAKKAGLLGRYFKATEGSSWKDSAYAGFVAQCRKDKMACGAYHFARPGNPVAQAEHFLKTAKIKPGDLTPMLDFEDAVFGTWTLTERTGWILSWMKVVEKAVGTRPFIYTQFDLGTAVKAYPLWTARYSNSNAAPRIPSPWASYTVHQFSNGEYGVPSSFLGQKTDLNTVADPKNFLKKYTIQPKEPEVSTPTTPYNRAQIAARAKASTTNVPGTCQLWTRTICGAPSAGDFDGDGSADAEDGWKAEPAKYKHSGDRNPPAGVPVAYGGGSRDNGHRAISLGNGMIRSTDARGAGKVATVPLNWPEKQWGLTYLGWSETCSGLLIPQAPKPQTPTTPPSGESKPRVLKKGSTGAAVKRLQTALNKTFPAYSKLTVDGKFGDATVAVVKEFQRRTGATPDGIVDGETRKALREFGIHLFPKA